MFNKLFKKQQKLDELCEQDEKRYDEMIIDSFKKDNLRNPHYFMADPRPFETPTRCKCGLPKNTEIHLDYEVTFVPVQPPIDPIFVHRGDMEVREKINEIINRINFLEISKKNI